MYSKATLDTMGKIVTFFSITLFLFVSYALYQNAQGWNLQALSVVILLVILIFSFGWAPYGYRIQGDTLQVLRFFGAKEIPLTQVTALRKIEADQLKGAIRTWGNGGLFGYYGKFRNAHLGKMQWYIRNKKNLILLEMNSGPNILISPDDPLFFTMLEQQWRAVQ